MSQTPATGKGHIEFQDFHAATCLYVGKGQVLGDNGVEPGFALMIQYETEDGGVETATYMFPMEWLARLMDGLMMVINE